MHGITWESRLIKARCREEIEEFVRGVVSTLKRTPGAVGLIWTHLEEQGIYVCGRGDGLLWSVVLACVLSDIGTQYSPYIRARNAEKIRRICEGGGLSFNGVVRLSESSEELLEELLSSKPDGAYPGGEG